MRALTAAKRWLRHQSELRAHRRDRYLMRERASDLSIFFDFSDQPRGGGNQFMRALRGEIASRGLTITENVICERTRACLFNSYNFDFDRLRAMHRPRCRMVHRVDGPLLEYRGTDDGTDRRIWEINAELADATVFQSQYSLDRHIALGAQLRDPVIIPNACDPSIFFPRSDAEPPAGRRVRLVAASWSANVNKGSQFYRWVEEHLDWERYEFTFVGQTPLRFERLREMGVQASTAVGAILRSHDIYVTASLNDPCSNSLLEALTCGLPALYIRSGGHAELVGGGGVGFEGKSDFFDCLERVTLEWETLRARIRVPQLSDVADQYLRVLGLRDDWP